MLVSGKYWSLIGWHNFKLIPDWFQASRDNNVDLVNSVRSVRMSRPGKYSLLIGWHYAYSYLIGCFRFGDFSWRIQRDKRHCSSPHPVHHTPDNVLHWEIVSLIHFYFHINIKYFTQWALSMRQKNVFINVVELFLTFMIQKIFLLKLNFFDLNMKMHREFTLQSCAKYFHKYFSRYL